jgi:hypothetical protein
VLEDALTFLQLLEGSTLGVHIVDLADAVVPATCEECGAVEGFPRCAPRLRLRVCVAIVMVVVEAALRAWT